MSDGRARHRFTSIGAIDPPTVADVSTAVGAVGWGLVVAVGGLSRIEAVIALAVLVLVPLGARLADTPRRDGRRSRWYGGAMLLQPPAAVAAVGSLWLSRGPTATALAVPWLVVTVALAGFGAWRLGQRGPWPLCELAVDAGLLYLPVAGVALLFDRLGVFLFFEPVIITLTVVHFHYAGFVLPLVAGLVGRVSGRGSMARLQWWTTAFVIVGPGVIAVGISFSPLIEVVAVSAFTTAVALLAIAVVLGVIPRLSSRSQQLLLGIGVLALPASMAVAVLYGLGEFTGTTSVTIGEMVVTHGQLNAFGFALCSLVALRLAPPASRARPPGIGFTRLGGDRRIGTDYFEREGLVADRPAAGMVESLDAYGCEGFDPDAADPQVRRFFERSGEYALTVTPSWSQLGAAFSRLWGPIARRTDQLVLPRRPATDQEALTGEVVALDLPGDEADGRAWVRSNGDRVDGPARLTYVAAYRRHVGDPPLLEVTFPLPLGTLTGLLRFEHADGGDGLVLSSHPARDNADDAGLYLVLRGFGIRLPLDETIEVSSEDAGEDAGKAAGEALTARHEVGLLGARLVALEYELWPEAA